jgi:hypothetical protein
MCAGWAPCVCKRAAQCRLLTLRNAGLYAGVLRRGEASCRQRVGIAAPPGGEVATLLWKVPSNFRRNLPIRHLVGCFNAYDASTEVVSFKTFLEFSLRLTRTEYQNRLRITNSRDYRVVVDVEMSRECLLAAVTCRYLLGFIGATKRGITRPAELSFRLGYYQPYLFTLLRNNHDNSLPMVNP